MKMRVAMTEIELREMDVIQPATQKLVGTVLEDRSRTLIHAHLYAVMGGI